ncbi:MAG: RIP metalloprotease RseP [Bacilli bacterium]|nr:RIP metalloprotease RseP [Bacilli bacterium]
MDIIVNILLLILILGIIILIHEFGHFIWAKKFGVYIYEFSLGMGPVVYSKKGKDGIDYNIRALPIGGFVQMAGEVYEDDKKVKKEKFMCNKPWYQRIIIVVAGVVNNFILAIGLLFIIALIWGAPKQSMVISDVVADSAFSEAGIVAGDRILEINNHSVSNFDKAQILLYMKSKNNNYEFVVEKTNGDKKTYNITPHIKKDKDGNETKTFGFQVESTKEKGIIASIKFAFKKFWSLIETMWLTISGLVTGKLSVKSLSGPVGIYQIVGETKKSGIENIIYLIALLSVNVGFINILPFPAFDGGRALFMLIEKIKGSPINSKIENTIHTIGFILLMILMIFITGQDILRIFK